MNCNNTDCIKNPNISIRPYREQDFQRLCEIHDPARRNELELAGLSAAFLPLTIAAEREGLFEYQLYVAEFGGTVAGFAAFTEDELAWLYVDVEMTRHGIGSSLIAYALDKMSDDVSVEVLVSNAPAIAVYSSFGFVVEKTITGVMPGNEEFAVKVHVMKWVDNAGNKQMLWDI